MVFLARIYINLWKALDTIAMRHIGSPSGGLLLHLETRNLVGLRIYIQLLILFELSFDGPNLTLQDWKDEKEDEGGQDR